MNSITMRDAGEQAYVQFPFALREAFRAVFKTSQWNASNKAYVVKNTAANRNKFERFKTEAAKALRALDAADDATATSEQLDRMRQSLSEISCQIEHSDAEIQETKEAIEKTREELARLRPLLESSKKAVAAVQAELAEAKAAIEAELAPAKSLCTSLGVKDAIEKLRSYSRRPFLCADEKSHFNEACRALRNANEKLGEALSVSLPALLDLSDANFNRLDLLRLSLERNSSIYRGIHTVPVVSDE